jgi:hypothetical protein
MIDWKNLKALLAVVALVAGGILYFAPNARLEQLWRRVDRSEINQEMLFQKKVIMMLKQKCEAGQCDANEKMCYEEAQHELENLREEKVRLKAK